jgi:hypothetical protein
MISGMKKPVPALWLKQDLGGLIPDSGYTYPLVITPALPNFGIHAPVGIVSHDHGNLQGRTGFHSIFSRAGQMWSSLDATSFADE